MISVYQNSKHIFGGRCPWRNQSRLSNWWRSD